MPRQIAAIVAGTCIPAALLFLVCAIKGMRRFGALGLWLVGWGLVFAHMKQGFVISMPQAKPLTPIQKRILSMPLAEEGDDPKILF
jgi:hypothetical protein